MPTPPLPLIPPNPPNFHHCAKYYGKGLITSQCLSAAAQLPVGGAEVEYRVAGREPIGVEPTTPLMMGSTGEPYILPWVGVVGQ